MKPQKFFGVTVLVAVLVLSLPAALVWVFDPFFVYHKPFFMADMKFDRTSRFQNAGIINSVLADPDRGFNSIILGTSMSQNFPLHENTVPLTLSGGRAKELWMTATKAIATGRVKTVLWEIHWSYSAEDPDALHPQSPIPAYLYNDTRLDDWKYFFNNDVVEKAMKIAKGSVKNRTDLSALNVWDGDLNSADFKNFNTAENAKTLRADLGAQADLSDNPPAGIRTAFPNIEQNLLPVLRAHPEIKFRLYFPPVSYYAYAVRGSEAFWTEMTMRQAVLDATADLNNVESYAFDLTPGIGDTLRNYKDPDHYAAWVNAKILDTMDSGMGYLQAKDFPEYKIKLLRKLQAFKAQFLD